LFFFRVHPKETQCAAGVFVTVTSVSVDVKVSALIELDEKT